MTGDKTFRGAISNFLHQLYCKLTSHRSPCENDYLGRKKNSPTFVKLKHGTAILPMKRKAILFTKIIKDLTFYFHDLNSCNQPS